jgi:large subunit ribosomal protein L25
VPKGVAEGGVLDQHMVELEIECLVTDIPETLHPLVEHLHVGDSLLVKDLELPPNVVALDDPDARIATVSELAIAETEEGEAVEGEGADSTEPERIGRVRKDEDEEGSS